MREIKNISNAYRTSMNVICNPFTYTIGDNRHCVIFISIKACRKAYARDTKGMATAIDPNGLTHRGAFHPQKSTATNNNVSRLIVTGGRVGSTYDRNDGLSINSSITSSINSSSIIFVFWFTAKINGWAVKRFFFTVSYPLVQNGTVCQILL